MASKYELTISTNYVPNWTYAESIRELLQNAIDNEVKNKSNEMYINYDKETEILEIGNKTSELTLDTLLLGSSTKVKDKDTIGKHGEGYKIAFMVLLREGKTIEVHNYGKKEFWETKLVKARRYNDQLVPQILIHKKHIWDKVPNNNLTIKVGGVTEEEYNKVVDNTLQLQGEYKAIDISHYGQVLLDANQKGRIYVNGLYVSSTDTISYGYNLKPSIIELDRDRRLIDTFDLVWNTSQMWSDYEDKDYVAKLIKDKVADVSYIDRFLKRGDDIGAKLIEMVEEENGGAIVPIFEDEDSDLDTIVTSVKQKGIKPVVLSQSYKPFFADYKVKVEDVMEISLKERFTKLYDKIAYQIYSESDREEFKNLIDKLD